VELAVYAKEQTMGGHRGGAMRVVKGLNFVTDIQAPGQ